MNPFARRVVCGLLMVLIAATAAAAQPRRTRPQRIDPLTSSIEGRVTTADTGAPIRGAEVRLSIDGRFSRLATTDAEGRYEMRHLPAGDYRLIVSKAGFITLEYGQRRPFESASTIPLGEGQRATANIVLIRGGAIVGRITDPFGEPSVGTRVQVLRNRAEDGARRLVPVGVADQTDDTGAFRIYGLPPGDYFVTASTGLVDAVKRDPPVYYPGTLTFAEAQPITLAAGGEASADFQIVESARGATVSGVVLTSTGSPAARAMIGLWPNSYSARQNAPGSAMLRGDAGPDGTFSIQNVPPGSYTLTAMGAISEFSAGAAAALDTTRIGGPPRALPQPPETGSMPLTVTSDGVSGITLTTRPGGRITGRFVPDTGVTQPVPRSLQVTMQFSTPGQMITSANNGDQFQMNGVGGPARIVVNGVPDGWAVKSILLDGEDVADRGFDLSGKDANVRIVMTDRVATLSGIVQSDRSRRDHNVIVFAEDAARWTGSSRFVRVVRADRDGRFRVQGLLSERYLVAALEYLEDGEEQDRQLLERLRNRATSVSLGEGEQRSIQLDLVAREGRV